MLKRIPAVPIMIALIVIMALSGCSLVGEVGNDAAPVTTIAQQQGGYPTRVATANVPTLEVFASRPGSGDPPPATPEGERPPIPRAGLNSAGVRKTADGWAFENPTYFGSPLVNVVTGEQDGWLKVMVAARPNGQEGWVRASDVTVTQHDFHGELDLSDRVLRVWQGEQPIAETEVVIGRDVTPTPVGRLYVNEILDTAAIGASQQVYGPWLLSTSAYSEALDVFDDGLPVIAFHGTGNPELIGSAASNGCIRMTNDVVTMLAETIPAGTPIEVVP